MEKTDAAKKGLYVGTGIGMIMFVLLGLLPGSLVGGWMGFRLAELMFGSPVPITIVTRIIAACSMIAGVMLFALLLVVGPALLGWCIGFVIDSVRKAKPVNVALPEMK